MADFKLVDGVLVEMDPIEETEFRDEQAAWPAPAVPEMPIARHQGLLALLDNLITEQMIRDGIALIEDETEREVARIRFEQPFWYETSEFIAWGQTYFQLSDDDVKNLFALARTK